LISLILAVSMCCSVEKRSSMIGLVDEVIDAASLCCLEDWCDCDGVTIVEEWKWFVVICDFGEQGRCKAGKLMRLCLVLLLATSGGCAWIPCSTIRTAANDPKGAHATADLCRIHA
jgi:hypothetical protein